MSEKKTVHTYSGQGKHLENAVLFIGCFVFLLLGLYLLAPTRMAWVFLANMTAGSGMPVH